MSPDCTVYISPLVPGVAVGPGPPEGPATGISSSCPMPSRPFGAQVVRGNDVLDRRAVLRRDADHGIPRLHLVPESARRALASRARASGWQAASRWASASACGVLVGSSSCSAAIIAVVGEAAAFCALSTVCALPLRSSGASGARSHHTARTPAIAANRKHIRPGQAQAAARRSIEHRTAEETGLGFLSNSCPALGTTTLLAVRRPGYIRFAHRLRDYKN